MALNVRLDDVIYLNTIKLAARYPTGGLIEHSEHRKAGDIQDLEIRLRELFR